MPRREMRFVLSSEPRLACSGRGEADVGRGEQEAARLGIAGAGLLLAGRGATTCTGLVGDTTLGVDAVVAGAEKALTEWNFWITGLIPSFAARSSALSVADGPRFDASAGGRDGMYGAGLSVRGGVGGRCSSSISGTSDSGGATTSAGVSKCEVEGGAMEGAAEEVAVENAGVVYSGCV